MKKFILLLFLFATFSVAVEAQLQQFHIGDTGYQIATKIRYLQTNETPDVVIGGYNYTNSGGIAINCQAVVMKVSASGHILWQKQFGIPGKNNLIQDMIITQDGNIVVVGIVGSTSEYAGNEAAILKYNSSDGSVLWQRCLHDSVTTSGGEIFFGVTQLKDGSGRIVTVGAHNYTPIGSAAMTCVFDNSGTFLYDEVNDISNGDEYVGVVADSFGNNVYMCGEFVGDYKDVRVHSYAPGTSSGTFNWSAYFDFYQQSTMQNNHASKIFISGSKLIINGESIHNYSLTSGQAAYVLTLDTNGTGAQIKGIQNNATPYANSLSIAVVSNDQIFSVQSPATSYIDPVFFPTGTISNAVATEITSLSSGTANTPVMFNSVATGEHAMLDMCYNGNLLYMAGATNVTSGFGNNDIYYVVSSPSFSSLNGNCDTAHGTVTITSPTWTSPTPTWTTSHFIPAFITVDTSSTYYSIQEVCGDTSIVISTTGEKNISTSGNISFYPNPVEDMLTISGTQIETVSIRNLLGQAVFSGNNSASTNRQEFTINTSSMQSGIYFINVNNQVMRKFLKK